MRLKMLKHGRAGMSATDNPPHYVRVDVDGLNLILLSDGSRLR